MGEVIEFVGEVWMEPPSRGDGVRSKINLERATLDTEIDTFIFSCSGVLDGGTRFKSSARLELTNTKEMLYEGQGESEYLQHNDRRSAPHVFVRVTSDQAEARLEGEWIEDKRNFRLEMCLRRRQRHSP